MISRIEIENFKSIQKMDLQLRDINILVGANGAGKSNFIQFFELLAALYNKNLQTYIAKQSGADNLLYFGLKNSEYLDGRIEFDEINAYFFRLLPNNEGTMFVEWEKAGFRAEGFTDFYEVVLNTYKSKESLISHIKMGMCKYINNHLSSFRVFHFHDTSPQAKIKQAANIDDNYFLREDGANLAAFLYWIQETENQVFKQIEQAIRAVAPYFERFDLKPLQLAPHSIKLFWKEKGSDVNFSAAHLSDGTLRFIALITLLLQPQPPKTIIIDEPELGLHPFAIYKLASWIKKASARSQIIISTQSAALLDYFEPEQVITVDRKNAQSVFTSHSKNTLAPWLEDYKMGDLWNKNIIGGRP